MNAYKKMGLGLVFLLAGSIFWGLGVAKVQADASNFEDIKTATFKFESRDTIIGTFGKHADPLQNQTVRFVDKDPYPKDNILNYKPQPNPFCGSVEGITLEGTPFSSDNTAPITAKVRLKYSPELDPRSRAGNICLDTPDKSEDPRKVTIAEATKAQAPTPAATSEESTSDCVTSDSSGLEWLFCPITSAISKAAEGMNGEIEDQLNFDVKGNLANKDEGYVAWTLVKNIVSALVVIVMLIMVIAQAIGGGPFDAYTIKKLLPRLVIAVIAMQLSWELCKWLISLSNDAGEGIKQLMLAPFGGSGNMDLNSILNRLDETWALGSQAILPTLLLGGVIVAFISLPGVLVAAFGLFIGIFAAFMVLLFRNVLIVALTIFAPLAFLAWTMPGTQTYWKLWRENFTKLLLMFPLIIAMLYVGRIFAWIVADAGTPGFIDYMTILVAYFGPYFLIFKSYKWGGSLLSSAGTGIAGARRGLTKANAPWIKQAAERGQGKLADKYTLGSAEWRKNLKSHDIAQNRVADAKKRIAELKAAGKDTSGWERTLAQREAEAGVAGKIRRRDRFDAALLRIGAGKPLPTSRQQLETLGKGAQYKKELVDQKMALMHQDYVEQLNSGASVGEAKEFIRDKYGIGNLKRDTTGGFMLDSEGSAVAKDGYTERAFHNWLVDTSSWMELGENNWRTKNGTTPDLVKTRGFMGMMNADPQRYKAVSSNFPLFQPFNQALGGGPKKEDFLVGGKSFAALEASNPSVAARIKKGDPDTDHLTTLLAEDSRYTKWFDNLEHTADLANVRAENYTMMAENIQQMKDSGIDHSSAESELRKLLGELKTSRTPEATSTLQRLMGGKKSARASVNVIMGDERWLEDALQVPIEVSGTVREVALPNKESLANDDVKIEIRGAMLADGSSRMPNLVPTEVSTVLALDDDYSKAAHRAPRTKIVNEFKIVRDNVVVSKNIAAVKKINAIVQDGLNKVNAEVQKKIHEATAKGVPLGFRDIEAYKSSVVGQAKDRINELRGYFIPLPAPGDDSSSELVIDHSEPPLSGPSSIITPDSPDWRPPKSSDLP